MNEAERKPPVLRDPLARELLSQRGVPENGIPLYTRCTPTGLPATQRVHDNASQHANVLQSLLHAETQHVVDGTVASARLSEEPAQFSGAEMRSFPAVLQQVSLYRALTRPKLISHTQMSGSQRPYDFPPDPPGVDVPS